MNFFKSRKKSPNKFKLDIDKWKGFLNYTGVSSEDSLDKEDLSFENEDKIITIDKKLNFPSLRKSKSDFSFKYQISKSEEK